MATINQKKKKIKLKIYRCSPKLKNNPQVKGRLLKIVITTPRKPNSALRKIGKILLVNKKQIFAKILGSGSIPQKFATVLIRGKGHRDTPSVRYSIIRGVYDCLPLYDKKRKRSLYGTPNPYKIYLKKILRSKMGSIGIIAAFLCIAIFSIILYWLSIFYSFFFAKWGKSSFHRDFYECGFRSIIDNKIVLDIHFAIVGIIFLIYEMEIILFVPIFLNIYNISFYLLLLTIGSLLILGLSYWYEWERYGLNWIF